MNIVYNVCYNLYNYHSVWICVNIVMNVTHFSESTYGMTRITCCETTVLLPGSVTMADQFSGSQMKHCETNCNDRVVILRIRSMPEPPVSDRMITFSSFSQKDQSMWNTYITEAIQSGHHKQYCIEHNIPYTTFNNKYKEYQQCTNNENWSPNSKRRLNHRVFTDSR